MSEKTVYTSYVFVGLITILLIFYLGISVSSGFSVEGAIYIESDGVPRIVLNGTVERSLEKIPLPAKPLPASVALYVNGELIAPIVVNNSVVISSSPGSEFSISYIPETNIQDGIIMFTYFSDFESYIYVDKNIVLLSLPTNILDSSYIDNTLVIKFKGGYDIQYAVKEGVTTPPPEVDGTNLMDILPILVIVLGGAGIASLLLLRRRGKSNTEEIIEEFIDETDRAILDVLKEKGGELYQSEIMRILGIPKTTLWRHLRRLEVLGYVEIKKEYKRNRVILKRHYSS